MVSKKNLTKKDYEGILAEKMKGASLPTPDPEYIFHPTRKWRFDLALPEFKIAIEMEGGTYGKPVFCLNCKQPVLERRKDGKFIPVFAGGRHNRPGGFAADTDKYNEAAILGWMVLRFTPKQIRDGTAIQYIQSSINARALALLQTGT